MKALLEICEKLAQELEKKMAGEAFFPLSSALSQGETFGTECCRRLLETESGSVGGRLEKFHNDGGANWNRFERADSPLLGGQYRAGESTWSFVLFSARRLVSTTGFHSSSS